MTPRRYAPKGLTTWAWDDRGRTDPATAGEGSPLASGARQRWEKI